MATSERSTHMVAVGVALIVTFLWSTSWILIRWGLDDEALDPLGFAALRYGLAAIVLMVWVLARPTSRRDLRAIDRRVLAQIAVLGLVLYGITQGAQFVAIDRQPAATTSLVLSGTPLLVAFISNRSLAESPTTRQFSGGVLVLVGASLYLFGALSATVAGMVAAVVALVANTGGSVLGRAVNRSAAVPAVVVTALSMSVGAAALVITSLAVEGWPTVSARAAIIIAWLAVVNTALAFTLWNLSLRRLSAVESAGINNTMLLQIALLAWWFLDESPGTAGFAGVLLVSLGIVLTQRNPRGARSRPMSRRPG